MKLPFQRSNSARTLRRAAGVTSLAFLALVAAPGQSLAATSQSEGTSSRVDVSVERGRLTVEARNVPLAKVLKAIAERADFRMRIKGDLNVPVTVNLTDVPLVAGIRRVVGRNSLIMTHGPDRAGSKPGQVASVLVSRGQTSFVPRPIAANTTFRLDGVYGSTAGADRVTRLRAIRSLAQQGDGRAIARLQQVVILERDPVLRRMAIMSLGRIGGDPAVPPLAAVLGDPDMGARMQAVRALGRVGNAAALEALAPALSDKEPNVRLQVIKMFGRWQEAAAVEALRDVLLDDSDPMVRREAVAALAGHSGEEAEFALEIAAADSDQRVRDAALAAIDRVGGNASSR